MREKIFNIIEPDSGETSLSKAYDITMIITICFSLIPLLFTKTYPVFIIIDKVTVTIFIIDYILRLITADYKLKSKALSFVKYPFTPMAIIDLLTILPSIAPLNSGLKALRALRLFRAMKVFRVFRYSKNVQILVRVFRNQKQSLMAVFMFALGYVFITALIMLQVEPQTFGNFFHAAYWATVSLTTVGYGDIFAVSPFGQVFTMISAFVGIAIVALPAGIITAGYLDEIQKREQS